MLSDKVRAWSVQAFLSMPPIQRISMEFEKIAIVHPKGKEFGPMNINKNDFDREKHILWDDSSAETKKVTSAKKKVGVRR